MTSCLPTLWAEAHPTVIRIMQLGRSYSRRLKSVKYDIYELYPSARHAYNTIRPAVKTSRPHNSREERNIMFPRHDNRTFFKDLVSCER